MKRFFVPFSISIILLIFVFFGPAITQKPASDHSDRIEGPFSSPKDVTKVCLGCHEEQASHFLETNHWTWLGEEFTHPVKGKNPLWKK